MQSDLVMEVGLLERSDWHGEFVTCPPQSRELPKDVFDLVQSFEIARKFDRARV